MWMRAIIMVLAGLIAMSTTHATSVGYTPTGAIVTAEDTIEQFIKAITKSKKPLPVWAVDMAMRAYKIWKTYKNGERVEQLQREVLEVLRLVNWLRQQIEADKDLSERELLLLRDQLDALNRLLNDLTDRVRRIESEQEQFRRDQTQARRGIEEAMRHISGIRRAADRERAKLSAWRHFNNVCREVGTVWRPALNRCLPQDIAGARR